MSKLNDLIYDLDRFCLDLKMAEDGITSWRESIKNAPYPENVDFAERQLEREKSAREGARQRVEKAYYAIGIELKLMGIL